METLETLSKFNIEPGRWYHVSEYLPVEGLSVLCATKTGALWFDERSADLKWNLRKNAFYWQLVKLPY